MVKMFEVAVKMAAHTLVGTILFLIVALPAVGLGLLEHQLESLALPKLTLLVIEGLEALLLATDALLFVVHIVRGLLDALKEVWHEMADE